MNKENNDMKYDCVQLENISAREFYHEYQINNRPCVFSDSITSDWLSRRLWVTPDGNPDFNYLKKLFGDALVPVADCKVKHYDSQLKKEMHLKDYIGYWEHHNSLEPEDRESDECLYLKDWHFNKMFPDYKAYLLPQHFTSDWLNEFWNERKDAEDDYKFVYMGPKGSWTPFHADVFRSYSWSANVCGRKRWILSSPALSKKLLQKFGKMPYDILSVTNINEDGLIEIIQKPGEIIFVPSNWYHQVYNLDDTISINHNWFNGSNIKIVWKFLKSSLSEVQQEIMDCHEMEDWPTHCQILMKAVHGMDYEEFYALLFKIAKIRIEKLHENLKKEECSLEDLVPSLGKNVSTQNGSSFKEMLVEGGKNSLDSKFEWYLIVRDLCEIKEILLELIASDEWQNLRRPDLILEEENLVEEITNAVGKGVK